MTVGTAGSAMQAIRDRIRHTWDVVDDADIERSGGSLEKLVDTIACKTGQPRAEVKRELRRLFAA